MSRRWRYAMWIGIGLFGLAGGAFWYAFIDRAIVQIDRDGWHMQFSYVRMACHVCTGKVEQLTWQGQPVGVPQIGQPDSSYQMLCSLGMFSIWSDKQVQWHFDFDHEPRTTESVATFEREDLSQKILRLHQHA